MLYVIAQVWGPLLLAALSGAVAGWFWNAARLRPRQRALEAERRRLRAELLDLAVGVQAPVQQPGGADDNLRRRVAELERALAEARGRGAEADVLRRRLADLERDAGARRVPAVDITDYTKRIATLEVEIESARQKVSEAEALQARIAELETPALKPSEADLLGWRARYFEARTKFLEHAADAAAQDQAGLRDQVGALQTRLAAPPVEDSEKSQLIARNRYLAERVKYLEGAAVARAGLEGETENRRAWRMRYLEKRTAHLESVIANQPPPPPPVDLAPFHTRIAALEQEVAEGAGLPDKLIEAEDEVIRARWSTRYLQARVNYLEERMGAERAAAQKQRVKPEPAPQSLPAAPPAPEVFRMERPAPLSSPRGGAPDDLTLIQGVSRQTESALRGLGVHHHDQIAAWTPAQAAWVNQYLNLQGRIQRERWIEQAQELIGAPA